MTIYQIALKLSITDRRVLMRAAQLLSEADKANNIKREKISQVEGTRTYMVNSYPDEMERQIIAHIVDAKIILEAMDERAKWEAGFKEIISQEMPVEVIPKKRILRPRIKKPFKQ